MELSVAVMVGPVCVTTLLHCFTSAAQPHSIPVLIIPPKNILKHVDVDIFYSIGYLRCLMSTNFLRKLPPKTQHPKVHSTAAAVAGLHNF